MKKYFLPILFTITSFFCVSITHGQTKISKPNIIYIYADDLGYGELGSYGQKKIRTPYLDQMAKEGIRFTQHYSSAPVCAPSRCMLMTGKNPGHAYIRGNYELGGFSDMEEGGQMPLHEGAYTIAKMLKERGYHTALVGKWGLGMPETTGSPLKHGFDYYYGYLDQKQAHNYYPTHLWENDHWDTLNNSFINVHIPIDSTTATDADFEKYLGKEYAPLKMTEKALAFIDKNSKAPFFLYLPYTLPHLSLQAPTEYVQKYIGEFEEKPYYGEKGYAANKYPLSTYAAMISFLDEQVGIIMQKIKALGLDNNTIILFSSDNGATFSAGVDAKFFNSVSGLKGLKMDVYEGGIRVPFIARWPGKIKENTISNLMSVQYDIMPTLAELTGKPLKDMDGVSLLPTLLSRQEGQRKHDFMYFEYPENGGQIAVRLGKWKGVKMNIRKNPNGDWALFNIDIDQNEKYNVANENPTIIQQMKGIAKQQHQHPHILEWEFIDPKIIKKGN